MKGYGQFCPMAKATELIGEKWTLLVLRELLLGTTRFNDFQRARSRMSPTLLAKRLRHLEESGVIIRKKLSGQKGYEYRLTAAGKELSPLLEVLAIWGMRWLVDNRDERPQRTARERVYTVSAMAVEQADHQPQFLVYGTTIAGRTIELRALVAGEIVAVHPDLRVGRTVEKGAGENGKDKKELQ